MQINFTGHSIEVTPALRNLVEEKFKKINHHFDHIISAHITFRVQKLDQIAEINVHVPKHQFHSSATSEDMYKAIDEMMNALDRQIVKHKEKLLDHQHKRGHFETATSEE